MAQQRAKALAAAERAKNAKRVMLVQQQETNEEEEKKRKEQLMDIERQLQEAMSVAVDTNRRIITLGEESKIKAEEAIQMTKEELERQK